ncbi:hypothetical protein FQN60_010449 [Etheostoma spectabile]|uniref:Uncharacterized protein n=1 Tax=Etheostoma spectabile TaxID=54343 RepID=A0A5J5D6V1_9PERO|nr:hypothetical protein FQN60_010449 [Etheostoma spectabile]
MTWPQMSFMGGLLSEVCCLRIGQANTEWYQHFFPRCPVTDLALSVRFQKHSSVLAESAPAANYKPTPAQHRPLAQFKQESQCPTKPQSGGDRRSRLLCKQFPSVWLCQTVQSCSVLDRQMRTGLVNEECAVDFERQFGTEPRAE